MRHSYSLSIVVGVWDPSFMFKVMGSVVVAYRILVSAPVPLGPIRVLN